MGTTAVKRVTDPNLDDVYPLVVASEREAFRFVRRFYDDYISGRNRFDRDGKALFIAQQTTQIVGICGLNRDPYLPGDTVGRIRRLYVHPAFRRHGVGRLLVSHVIADAQGLYERLTLLTDTLAAAKFYRTLGFLDDGTSRSATHFLELN